MAAKLSAHTPTYDHATSTKGWDAWCGAHEDVQLGVGQRQ